MRSRRAPSLQCFGSCTIMIKRILFLVVCVFGLNPSALAQNWPQFRGAEGNGVVTEGKHPEKWSAEEHLAWKTKIPGVGWSQPIVWGDKVFVTTAVSDQ